jgi:Na+/H+ antiporter NhaD/arsenite permease-like protein
MENLIPVWALIPFVVMLLCIAVAPLFAEKWWESNLHKLYVSLILGIPVAAWMLASNTEANGFASHLLHQMVYDYVPFIMLLMALFVVTGGIKVGGDIQATPKVNTLFLGIGYVLASLMGTTGAAMLLIRPLITTNQQRQFKTHTILFFIAAVANCGGLLTPLGDPPLFLLYLRGASFGWFLNLLPIWLFAGVCLLGIYYLVDSHYYKREPKECLEADNTEVTPLSFSGKINILWLLCIIACVMFINPGYIPAMGEHDAPAYLKLLREIALAVVILLSWLTTSQATRRANNYSWTPIIEVAVLFLGIFATMTPALMFLNANAEALGLTRPWQFFYSAGLLSSFLDNAPTAVAFHTVASGLPMVEGATIVAGIQEILLKAIATGAVFFGAMTYIGNGPNFMVKAIAEQNGIKMPSFFGYMGKFSLIVLLPIYIIAQLLFF